MMLTTKHLLYIHLQLDRLPSVEFVTGMHLLLGIIERTQLNCTTWFRLKHPSQARQIYYVYVVFYAIPVHSGNRHRARTSDI